MNPDSTLVVTKTCPKDGVHLSHTMRKTWGHFAFHSCVPLEVIMHKLGHQSPSATLRYLGIRDDDVKAATETLNL